MNPSLLIVLSFLGAAVGMFALNRPRMDAVALIVLTTLPFTGIVTMGEALSGFSDPNIVLIAALFVVGEGLVRTGVAQRLGDWLTHTAGGSETRMLVLLMLAVGILGSVMSSTGVVAIFIPVALRIAHGMGLAPGRLMMPLSMAALISGMMTLVGTAPNLVVNSELMRSNVAGFRFFTFTPFGSVILILGVAYMLFARRWLTSRADPERPRARRRSLRDWIEQYQLASRELRVRIPHGSPLVGRTLSELDLRQTFGINVIAIERNRRLSHEVFGPSARTLLEAEDILLLDLFSPGISVEDLLNRYALQRLPLGGEYFSDWSQEIGMAEVMVAENSGLVGKTVVEAQFRSDYGLTAIGLRRRDAAVEQGLRDIKLKFGDTLLLIGPWKDIRRLQADTTNLLVLNLPSEVDEVLPAAGRAPQAMFCLALMVVLMVTGVVPNVQSALIACLLMGALRCIDFESAYRSIHWKSLILIVGMLPFSTALERTGGVQLAAQTLMAVTGDASLHVVLACLFLITAVLGLFISNTATAVLMAPVAVALARDLNASPHPFAMIVALAASSAFMTPVSSPVNTLVLGPGNYQFSDFVKVGVPFTVIVLVVCVIMVPWLLPFTR